MGPYGILAARSLPFRSRSPTEHFGRPLDDRKGEVEAHALVGPRVHPDPTAMLLHDPFADGQANSGAGILVFVVQALEKPEDLLRVLRIYSDSVVRTQKFEPSDPTSTRGGRSTDRNFRLLPMRFWKS